MRSQDVLVGHVGVFATRLPSESRVRAVTSADAGLLVPTYLIRHVAKTFEKILNALKEPAFASFPVLIFSTPHSSANDEFYTRWPLIVHCLVYTHRKGYVYVEREFRNESSIAVWHPRP